MKYFSTIILFFCLFSCRDGFKRNNSQNNEYSQINKYLDFAKNEQLSNSDRIKFADSAFLQLIKQSNDSLSRKKLFNLANRYYNLYELEKYKKTTHLILNKSINAKDTIGIAKANWYLADYYFEKTQNDSALMHYKKAEELFSRKDDAQNLAKVILYKAYIYLYEKDYLESEVTTIRALNTFNEDDIFNYECYVNLGSSLYGLENFEKALFYHNKSLKLCEKLKKEPFYEPFKAQSYNNIGLVYLKQKKYKEAEQSFRKGLAVEQIENKHTLIYASLLDNLGYTLLKLSNDLSFDYLNKSLQIRDSLKNTSGIIKSKIHLSEYFLNRNKKGIAYDFNKEAYDLAKESKFHEDVLTTLHLFNKINPENALKYSSEYIALTDSLYKTERETRNKLARIEFETDEIIQEKEFLSEQRKIILLISIIVISFSIFLYIILFQRSKQKELVFEQEQKSANEEIYKLMINQQNKIEEVKNAEKNRIAKELHDGIMNKLTSTRLNLFILSKRRDDETITKCVNYINDIQNIEKEIRSLAHELNNDIFTQKNSFKNILKELIDDQNKLFPSKCVFQIGKRIKWDNVDASVKMNLFRIIQEALNNCNKYSEAKNIDINIYKDDSDPLIILSIEDNGIGFDLEKKKNGIGMKNMTERANSIGGKFKVFSELNMGTSILVENPIT